MDRLYHLASSGCYDGTVIFRVGPTASYPGGMVMLARGGSRTRTAQLAIDLSPNTGLGTVSSNGVVGFPPIAEVVEGRRHGNGPTARQDSIAAKGREYLDRVFPGLDRIVRVTIGAAP